MLHHIRANAVAYLALFVALGGTGYAATSLPAGSVGARQIRNHVIQPVKLDPNYIGGNVRLWASVSASGRIVAGGRGMRVTGDVAGDYIMLPSRTSHVAQPSRCAAIASVDDHATTHGYANAEVDTFTHGPRWTVVVETFAPDGTPAPLPFDVEVIC